MRTGKFSDLKAKVKAKHPEVASSWDARIAELREYGEHYQRTLSELRRARAKTQVQVAQELGIDQPQISKLEKRTDLYLSTLERYVAALGGQLELTAVFGDERFLIRLSDLVADDGPADGCDSPEPLPDSDVAKVSAPRRHLPVQSRRAT